MTTPCTNERCIGVRIFQRAAFIDGSIIEYYICARCHTISSESARSLMDITVMADDDTDLLPSVRGDDVEAVAS